MKKKITKQNIIKVLDILEETFPDAKAELEHTNPFELLIATILSAQCTDVRVNKVTKDLFKELKKPEDYIALGEEELGEKIRTCGFYNSKSKNIIGACMILLEKFDGRVPNTMEELLMLPGVGRKTASVVLSVAFDIPAVPVDTHVFRTTNRIGIVDEDDVEKTELALMKALPKHRWNKAHHLFIFLGRRVCKARKPDCDICSINDICLKKIK